MSSGNSFVSDVAPLRLVSHGLADPRGATALASPLEVTERLLTVQAQDFPASKWALGVRSPGTTVTDVEAALNCGLIVRSWPMRAALYLVPATELHWMLRLSTRRLVAGEKTRHVQLGLTFPSSRRTIPRLTRAPFFMSMPVIDWPYCLGTDQACSPCRVLTNTCRATGIAAPSSAPS